MENQDGLEIVLTPIQLAAVLEGETLEESESLTNRFWGAATLVGGAIELVGAGVLLLAPEPTTVTKIAGGALGAHGLVPLPPESCKLCRGGLGPRLHLKRPLPPPKRSGPILERLETLEWLST